MMRAITFQGQPVQELVCGESRALFAPQHGGRLLLWEVHGEQIVVWPEGADWSKVLKVRGGNPVLFPFIARHMVAGEIGKWQDAQGVVRELPMHGFARGSAFEVVAEACGPTPDGAAITMRLRDSAETRAGYPFSFCFDVRYVLGERTLAVEFITHNSGSEPLPYYAGHHFYFNVPAAERGAWELDLPFAARARQRDDGSIEDQGQPLAERAPLDAPWLMDTFFIEPTRSEFLLHAPKGRWGVRFALEQPASAAPWHAVTCWTETATSDFFCIEPWLGLPNAIHHGRGLRWLAAGATELARCSLHAVRAGE